jgi:hypothetical protein
MSSWHYQIMRHTADSGEDYLAIHEYYTDARRQARLDGQARAARGRQPSQRCGWRC